MEEGGGREGRRGEREKREWGEEDIIFAPPKYSNSSRQAPLLLESALTWSRGLSIFLYSSEVFLIH